MKSSLLYKEMMPEAYSLSLHHTNALFSIVPGMQLVVLGQQFTSICIKYRN